MAAFDSNTSVAIILGADKWPHFADSGQALNGGSPFKNSGALANAFFRSKLGFGFGSKQVLNLFNSDNSSSDQITEISEFLKGTSTKLKENKTKLTDIFLFYVGHGDFYGSSNDLLMLVRDSRPGNPQSGIQSESLAAVLKVVAPRCRHVVILDCCWSGAAIKSWQGTAPADVAARKITNKFPGHGTVLICSSSKDMPSMAPPEARFTLFTGAFFETLLQGSPENEGDLSAREVKELAFERMEENWPELATRPVVQGIERGSGDLSEKAYFRNPRRDQDLIDQVINDVPLDSGSDDFDDRSVLVAKTLNLSDSGRRTRPTKVLLGTSLIALVLLIATVFYFWFKNYLIWNPWSDGPIVTAPPPAAFNAGDDIVVSVDALNLRFGPGVQEKIVGQLIKGERYSVNEVQGDWLELFPIVDGTTEPIGWVHSSFVVSFTQSTRTRHSSITQEELNQALDMAAAVNNDRLLRIASDEIGVREMPGPEHNPRIAEYNSSVAVSFDPEDKTTSWNSQFVGWVALQAEYETTGSAQSRSWENWGQSSEELTGQWQVGCIMVAWRFAENDWRGTVGFYLGENGGDSVRILSGDVRDAVDAQIMPKERVTACRLPDDYQPIATLENVQEPDSVLENQLSEAVVYRVPQRLDFVGDLNFDGRPDFANFYNSANPSNFIKSISGQDLATSVEPQDFLLMDDAVNFGTRLGVQFEPIEDCKNSSIFGTRATGVAPERLPIFEFTCFDDNGHHSIYFYATRLAGLGETTMPNLSSAIAMEFRNSPSRLRQLDFDGGLNVSQAGRLILSNEDEIIIGPFFWTALPFFNGDPVYRLDESLERERPAGNAYRITFEDNTQFVSGLTSSSFAFWGGRARCEATNHGNVVVAWGLPGEQSYLTILDVNSSFFGGAISEILEHDHSHSVVMTGLGNTVSRVYDLDLDLDGDGLGEIFVSSSDGVWLLSSADICAATSKESGSSPIDVRSSVAFSRSLWFPSMEFRDAFSLGDMDGDGVSELLIHSNNPRRIHIFGSSHLSDFHSSPPRDGTVRILDRIDVESASIRIFPEISLTLATSGFDLDEDAIDDVLLSTLSQKEVGGANVTGNVSQILFGSDLSEHLKSGRDYYLPIRQ